MSSKPLVAIVLARLDSSRFPGKALERLSGTAIIEHVFRRLVSCQVFDAIILATTSRSCDDALAEHFGSIGGKIYRGPADEVHDLAKRFVSAARSVNAEFAMRANGDSPFPDPWLIKQGVEALEGKPEFVTNLLNRTYPYGISVEFVKVSSLEQELPRLTAEQREHVTACFYAEPERFRIQEVPPCPWPACLKRLTVDEPADLDRLQAVVNALEEPVWSADLPTIIKLVNAQTCDEIAIDCSKRRSVL